MGATRYYDMRVSSAVRLPFDLHQQLAEFAETNKGVYRSRNHVMERALEEFFERQISQPDTGPIDYGSTGAGSKPS